MSIFSRLFRGNTVTFSDLLPVSRNSSGMTVNKDTAITLSAVYACVNILSETVSSLPLAVHEIKNGQNIINNKHRISYLVDKYPNKIMTRMVFIQTLMASVVYQGNGYALIHREKGVVPKSLEYIHPDDITIAWNKKHDDIIYIINNNQYKEKKVVSDDMIHILGLSFDGIQGLSPLSYAREIFGNALAEQQFQGKFMRNGATLGGVLTQPGKVSDEQMKRLKSSWKANYEGSSNTGKTAILENGMEYKTMGIKPVDAQFLEQRKFSTEDIARIFNVPLHLIKDLSRSTNNNIEQQSLEFVQYTIRPWIKKFEAEFDKKLLLEDEKKSNSVFIRFNVDGLLRGDVKTRAELYKTLNMIGALSANEVRVLEGHNPYKGGDKYFVQANMQTTDNAIK